MTGAFDAAVIVAALTFLAGVAGIVLNYITRDRVSQLREDLTRVDARLRNVERDLDLEQAWNRIVEDYAELLRRHIYDGIGPPAPPWPKRPGEE